MTPEQARAQIAACEALLTGSTSGDAASDGPDERTVSDADEAWLAERAERVEQRWREGAA